MSIFDKIFKTEKKDKSDFSSGSSAPQQSINPTDEDKGTKAKENITPNDFPEAVCSIIAERGSEVVNDRIFVNILNDYQVLKAIPALKHTLLLMQDNLLFDRLLKSTNWELDSINLGNQFVQNYGLKESIVKYAIQCIGFGLGKEICKPVFFDDSSTESKPSYSSSTNFKSRDYFLDNLTNGPQSLYDPKLDLPNYKLPQINDVTNFQDSDTLSLDAVVASQSFENSKCELPVALGISTDGQPAFYDLTQMPHLLIAGSTGKGKSAAIHNMIISLLCKKHPAELKFALFDTKGIEFSMYKALEHHFLAVRNDELVPSKSEDIINSLKSICIEMDNRGELLRNANARNIESYNSKFCSRLLDPYKGNHYMPYIVVVVDDLGNLMFDCPKDAERIITRIAQKGHLVGIHMIISTQITTKEILTPALRTQFSTRMAFGLLSTYESKLVIRTGEAANIHEPGDFFFMTSGQQVLLHAPYQNDMQLNSIINCISSQQGYLAPYPLPVNADENVTVLDDSGVGRGMLDPIFADAARLVVVNQLGSTSLIQRKFGIGYNRAGRIMDQLEMTGIVGRHNGSTFFRVLVADEVQLDRILKNLNI